MVILSRMSVVAFLLHAPTLLHAFPGADHQWQAPDSTQARGPCPGLNTAANHGFINRSGRDISIPQTIQVMEDLYALITWQTEFIFHSFIPVGLKTGTDEEGNLTLLSLEDLYAFPFIHDSSFVHKDAGIIGTTISPTSPELWEEMKTYSSDGNVLTHQDMLTYQIDRIEHSLEFNPDASEKALGSVEILNFLSGEKIFMLLAGGHETLQELDLGAMESFLVHNRLPHGYLPRQARGLEVVNVHTDFARPIFDFFYQGIAAAIEDMSEPGRGNQLNLLPTFPGADYQWQAPDSTRSRGPCPGLNTAANHGFINRSGRDISIPHTIQVMEDLYSLITWQTEFIFNSFIPVGLKTGTDEEGKLTLLSLEDLYAFPFIHDSSFVHKDAGIIGTTISPTSLELWEEMKTYSSDGKVLTHQDMLTYQIDRIAHSLEYNPKASEKALGSVEILNFLSGEKIFMLLAGGHETLQELDLGAMESFLVHNRLPDGYLPRQARGLEVVNVHTDFARPIFEFFYQGISDALMETDESHNQATIAPPSQPVSLQQGADLYHEVSEEPYEETYVTTETAFGGYRGRSGARKAALIPSIWGIICILLAFGNSLFA